MPDGYIYRRAWDDYEVVLVLGSEESRRELDGTTVPSDVSQRLVDGHEQRLPGVFFLTENSAFWDDLDHVHTPDIPDTDEPDAWRADDGLLVHLADASGAPLGFLSVDEPVSGRRPEDEDLRLLRAICSHAEQALESSTKNERAASNQRVLAQLLAASPALSACSTIEELLGAVCDTVVPHLGFERVATYQCGEQRLLELSITRGWGRPSSAARHAAARQDGGALDPVVQTCRLLASHDPLTGVRNRRRLSDLLAAHSDAALLVCDLDHFKQVNDRHGHDIGDRVLARFGKLLRELTRDTDVAMRLGGEEFCVMLPYADRFAAIQTAERLRLQTSARMRDLVPDGITVSVGVAATSAGVIDGPGLLAAADRGLYAAKAAGRDRSFDASDGHPRRPPETRPAG